MVKKAGLGATLCLPFALAGCGSTDYDANWEHAETHHCEPIAEENQLSNDIKTDFIEHCADAAAFHYLYYFERATDYEKLSTYKKAHPESYSELMSEFRGKMETEAKQWEVYNRSLNQVKSSLKELALDSTRPFANADIDINLQSLFPLVDENGETTSTYTGKFSVTITDPGSNASREFSYDHGTGNIMHSNGTTSGTFEFTWHGTWSSGAANGSVNFQHTGTANCDDDQRRACIVVDTVLQAINTKLSEHELTKLNAIIAKAAERSNEDLNYRAHNTETPNNHTPYDEVYYQVPVWNPRPSVQ